MRDTVILSLLTGFTFSEVFLFVATLRIFITVFKDNLQIFKGRLLLYIELIFYFD